MGGAPHCGGASFVLMTMTNAPSGNSDFTYMISAAPSPVLSALASQSKPNCPVTVTLEVQDLTSTWIAYDDVSSTISPAIQSFNALTGSFDVSTSSITFAPQTVFAMKETYTSVDSQDPNGTFVD